MLIPIRHEKMSARRWPVITVALIVINLVAFVLTNGTIHDQIQYQLGEVKRVKDHILILASLHPELRATPEVQQYVEEFRKTYPERWKRLNEEIYNREVLDGWDAHIRMTSDTEVLQAEMDKLGQQYGQLDLRPTLVEEYGFVPAHPRPLAYLTANFLHSGWLHLIGNMWFLWLAGLVLEDTWGRVLYTIFYFAAGAAALQFHAWTNAGSLTAAIGASGAVAALMGAFLVRFPTMQITMALIFLFRKYTFEAQAYWLLPLWVLAEVARGSMYGSLSGVAHWAHVGGFVFGVLIALALRYSGLEHKANQAIEAKIAQTVIVNHPDIVQATEFVEKREYEPAISLLKNHLAANPDSIDAASLLQQIYWQKNDWSAYHEQTIKLIPMLLKARDPQLALQHYEEFLSSGGQVDHLPASIWFDLCRALEKLPDLERALEEYQKLAAVHPADRHALMSQVAAARIAMKLNRAQEALKLFQAASASPVPHLDWEQTIAAGIRQAQEAMQAAPLVPSSR